MTIELSQLQIIEATLKEAEVWLELRQARKLL